MFGINLRSFNCFSSINISPTVFLIHHFVQVTTPFLFEYWFEELVLIGKFKEFLTHEIFKYIVCSIRHN